MRKIVHEILTFHIKNKSDGGYTEEIDLVIIDEIIDTYLMPYVHKKWIWSAPVCEFTVYTVGHQSVYPA